eukprot:2047895-Amphidinium_carterae.1
MKDFPTEQHEHMWPLLPGTLLGHLPARNAWSGNLTRVVERFPNPERMNLLGQQLARAIEYAYMSRRRCTEDAAKEFQEDIAPEKAIL